MKKYVSEASKILTHRPDIKQILKDGSKVLDVGAGPTAVVEHAQRFDVEHGDANYLEKYFKPKTFDVIFASHVVEHLFDPQSAVDSMLEILKNDGWLIILVPHWLLYEKGSWPSNYNYDHKKRFAVSSEKTSLIKDLVVVEDLTADHNVKSLDIKVRFMLNEIQPHELKFHKQLTTFEVYLGKFLQKIHLPFYLLKFFTKYIDVTRYENQCAQVEILIQK